MLILWGTIFPLRSSTIICVKKSKDKTTQKNVDESKGESDMAGQNLIKKYVDATAEKRVEIIIKNYSNFIGIVEGYTEGIRYMIECEKESNSRRDTGDLGVRVQTSGSTSDPTAKKAIRNVITRDAIVNCDFSGDVMDGVERAEAYIKDAYVLRDMRKDYKLFNSQLGILGQEREMFVLFISKEKAIGDFADEQGITYESVQQRIHKCKVKMKKQVTGFMKGNPGGIA